MGMSGHLLGWTPFMHNAIRRKAAQTLDIYIIKGKEISG